MSKIKLMNVRLAFASIFERSNFNGQEGKFECTMLLPKSETATYTELSTAIEGLIKENKIKVSSDKRCLKDGDDSDYDGFADCWSIKAANKNRPIIVDRDRTPLMIDDDNAPYSGAYCNVMISLWCQNNNYGKRINANLEAIQFVEHGDKFGGGSSVDIEDAFDDIS